MVRNDIRSILPHRFILNGQEQRAFFALKPSDFLDSVITREITAIILSEVEVHPKDIITTSLYQKPLRVIKVTDNDLHTKRLYLEKI